MTTNHRASPAAVLVAIAVILLPLGYVLSLGPAIWLHQHGVLSEYARVIYAPLEFLHDQCKPIGDALEWYAGLWR